MKTHFRYSFIILISAFPLLLHAQTDPEYYDYPQNHLEWFTIESDHFLIQFQEGNSRSAQVVSRIAEEIYPAITSLYEYEPDQKVSIVLKDREDYSNGAAYFFDNKIDIWLPSLDSPLRGTHNWLRNVITHEYTHIIQIQKGMKRSRKIPVMYIQWLNYEKVRRPDVLYGFPNGIVSLPFASINIPAWLAEGTAQYQRKELHYDTWDSHRDMILRTRILSDTYFTLEEMGSFASKTSIERETVYNQGFAFVIYLADRFGDDVLRLITEALAERGVYNVAEAIEIATGIPGKQVFNDWIAERKEFYTKALENTTLSQSEYVEKDGFFNFYPKKSPDGKSLAYLSNKGRDYSLLSLYITNDNGDVQIAEVDDKDFHTPQNHTDAIRRLIFFLSTSYSFSPDGTRIVYSVNKKNKYGEDFRDLYIFNITTRKTVRLTHNQRIESPAWSPDGKKIAAVQYHHGTQNIVLLNPEEPAGLEQLTDYKNGETVFSPTWLPNGKEIIFSFADFYGRGIYSFDLAQKSVQNILYDQNTDFRDPYISKDGKTLYFSANPDDIFNIYKKSLADSDSITQLTSVVGGAFMPFVEKSTLYFSEYEADGYKIKKTTVSEISIFMASYSPQLSAEQDSLLPYNYLNTFNDKDLSTFPEEVLAVADTGAYTFTIETREGDDQRTYQKYKDTFTSFSFYPLIRFDNYSSKHGNNGTLIKNGQIGKLGENILRDMKPGLYFTSRDVLDKLTIFGGVMFGVASKSAESIGDFFDPNRLTNLDRDIYFSAEYRGLPIIKRSWSPTVAVEVYNMHRNVDNGLSIEEFPCTSCLPDTTTTDISYDIWEVDLFLRSKLSRRSLLEFGIGYTPYKVNTESFYSRELKQYVSGSSSEYFRGTTLSAAYTFNYYTYSTDADIAPIGLKGYLRYQYQPSKLLEEYEVKDGTLKPLFATSHNHSSEMQLRYGFRMINGQAFQARVRGFTYFNNPKDPFYLDYVGGFLGMRSYPYFAIGGNTTAFTSLSWFTPILKNVNKQVGPYIIDKLYARIFFETGNAWYLESKSEKIKNERFDTGNNLKSGIGAELRLAMNSYYLFPIRFFVSAAYGFNEFSLTLPDEYLTGSQSNRVTYGRELLFHFGLTFDFELL